MEDNISSAAATIPVANSRGKKILTGRILSGIAVLFMLFDSISKITGVPQVMKASVKLGYPASTVQVIGIILLILIILYVMPRTSIFGAILLTGYLGGAVASNLRIMNPLFSNTLFPIYFAIILWGGIYLRDDLIRELIPFRKKAEK